MFPIFMSPLIDILRQMQYYIKCALKYQTGCPYANIILFKFGLSYVGIKRQTAFNFCKL